ncbi:hypothetical protein N431DRAFT_427821 [Stipitochalara longipes BDJ]|nr:hypothetical protein N431DRAFT_427821 [Stipitochalara longipes BDJ]
MNTAKDDHSPDTSTPHREAKRVACIRCRQSKLRCDSPKHPCSRCARLNVPCKLDAQYKRVNKRSKIDELEKQLVTLRDAVQSQHPPVIVANLSTDVVGPATASHVPSLSQFAPQLSQSPHTSQESPYAVSSIALLTGNNGARPAAQSIRAIDSMAFSLEEIDTLFNLFFEHYHPFFPLIHPDHSPDRVYESSALLFWAIISIASRRHAEKSTVLGLLAKSVQKLMWSTISAPPLTITAIQALLLLCMWPFPDLRIWSDNSLFLSSIAVNSAMHMGLHRPQHLHEYIRYAGFERLPVDGHIKTWAACNIVSQYMSAHQGAPPQMAGIDWSIDRACEVGNQYTLPDDMRYHLILSRFCDRVTRIMSGNNASPLGMPADGDRVLLMNVLEQDLNTIEAQFDGKLSQLDAIHLIETRLYLRIFYFFDSTHFEHRKSGILKAYNSATDFIALVTSSHILFNYFSYTPIANLKYLAAALAILIQVLNSNLCTCVDYATGAASIEAGLTALQNSSIESNDVFVRASEIFSYIWRMQNDNHELKKLSPTLLIKSRLSASLLYDSLWRWRQYHIKEESLEKTSSAGGGLSNDDTGLQYQDPNAMDWTLFDNCDWLWDLDNIPMPGAEIIA